MKDFHVAPVEIEQAEQEEGVHENPLDRFRRISKQVASQSASVKWGEVIRSVAPEANTQIGRCRNRESFKNQQNLLKAMEQARKLIERAPMASPRCHSPIELVDDTSRTLVQLLQNISEEINELSPQNTLNVRGPNRQGSSTPLQSLNAQLQTVLSKTPSPRLGGNSRPGNKTPRSVKSPCNEKVLSPPKTPITPKPCQTPKTPRSPSPTGSKSLDDNLIKVNPCLGGMMSPPPALPSASPTPPPSKLDSIQSPPPAIRVTTTESMLKTSQSKDNLHEKSASPKLIDFNEASKSVDKVSDDGSQSPLKQGPGSPVKVIKRKAPAPVPGPSSNEIAVSRPVASKPQPGQGMIPPPPEIAPKVPILSMTPATPLLPQKDLTEVKSDISKESEPTLAETPKGEAPKIIPTTVITVDAVTSDSTEQLISSKEPGQDANKAASSPPCLRPARKVEDVKTIKRQPKSGWL